MDRNSECVTLNIAHCGHLVQIKCPQCAAERCSQEPLSCSTFIVNFINVVYDVKIYMFIMSHNGMASVKSENLAFFFFF